MLSVSVSSALVIYWLASTIFCQNESSLPTNHGLPKPSVKIVGGEVIKITDAPYQVSIRNVNGMHFCGGTIISNHSILTAAHCVIGTSKMLYVAAGVGRLDEGSNLNPVTAAVVHNGFNKETMLNDLAILRVRWDLGLDNVTKKALPIATETPPDGTPCTTSGWGTTRYDPENGEPTIDLRMTSIPMFNTEECSEWLGELPNGQICAGYKEGGHDSCQGDSGGPLQCNGMITGIVSWGFNCGKPYQPGVYTSVPFYKDWILAHINSSTSSRANNQLICSFLAFPVLVSISLF